MFLSLEIGYFTMYALRVFCKFLASGMNLYDNLPQVTGPEWRLDLYRAGDHIREIFFDLVSPVDLPEFRGEFGLFNLLEMAAEKVLGRLRRQYFSTEFETPIFLLSSEYKSLKFK